MGLDNATVKEFANLINPFDKTSGEATVYGRVIGFNEVGGRPIVNLDGSTQNIPIRTTVKVKGPKGSPGDQDYYAGDRVLVRIKNHEALIISNISTQMTTAEGAEDAAKQYVSDNGFIYAEKISGQQGDFYTLSSDKFTATQITGALGHFITVNADRIITDAINAQIANIDTIKASDVVAGEGDFAYLNVDNVLDAKMANLDIANINKANIGTLFANMGLISSATIVDGHVTGYLDSVEVNANKITAGTLLVDRLYIKDQNNKWKMQTVDGQGQTVYVEAADRINERTITADKLVAHSITTDELNATNITANNSSFMESLTNSLTTNYLFATQANVQDLVAHSVDAELAELDILNINEELKTQNIHLGEIVFDQPTKPEVMSGNPDYLLGIERETKTISAYDSTTLYSEGDYVTHYYSKDNINTYPYGQTTRTTNGITFTDNGDGTITANGTATANATFSVHARFGTSTHNNENNKLVLPNDTYILSGSPEGSSTSTYYMDVGRTVDSAFKRIGRATSTPLTFTANGDDSSADEIKPTINIVVLNGQTVDNVTFEPKIRLATNEDATWYPFVKGVYKCIKPITTAELWDDNKWYYLRDAVSGDQYEFDYVRYTDFGSFEIDNPSMLFTDPTFKTGVNGTHVYNNAGGSVVALNRVTRSSDNPTDSGYEMQITKAAASESQTSPGFGGFYWSHQSAEGKVFRYKIIAKFPVYATDPSCKLNIAFATNAIGNHKSVEWLTPTAGTGKFEEYVCQVYCGGGGTFSTTGFFYLYTGEMTDYYQAFDWRVAYATCFDIFAGDIRLSSTDSMLEKFYPIGYIWISADRKNPGEVLGYGIWILIDEGYTLTSKDGNFYDYYNYYLTPSGNTKTIPTTALTIEQIPWHNHGSVTGTVSSDHGHGQMITARIEGHSDTSGIVRDDYSQDNNCCSQRFPQGTNTNGISANHTHSIPAQGGSGAHGHGSISVEQASMQVFMYRRIA